MRRITQNKIFFCFAQKYPPTNIGKFNTKIHKTKMTTTTIYAVAGPFSDVAGQRLEPMTEYNLVTKVKGVNVVLPANNIITEISIKRKAPDGDATADLTAGRGIAIGVSGSPRIFTGTPGIITDDLNAYDLTPADPKIPYIHISKFVPTADMFLRSFSSTQNQQIVLQSAFGGNVTSGGVAVIIKYKPFSESVAEKYN
jgi:hypothetical protein